MKRTNDEIYALVGKLHQIPHLRLPLTFDPILLQKELELVDSWNFHRYADFEKIPDAEMREYSRGYSGVSLYEFNGEANYVTDNYEIFEHDSKTATRDPNTGHVLFFSTAAIKKMPYVTSVLDQISPRKGRTRIMRSEPDHAIAWHSHNRGPWVNPFMHEAIVHVPIKTDRHVLHSVCDHRDPVGNKRKLTITAYDDLVADPTVYRQSYGEGECWIFNSWHDHYYHNYSKNDRYSIISYIRWFDNEAFVDLVAEAVKKYDGPLLLPD